MKKRLLLILVLLPCLAVTGCRLSINRLNKRIDRWESIKKDGFTEKNVKFARETLFYFLNTVDFQRSRESLVSEGERLQYHQKLSALQVFLMDYHAAQALAHVEKGDWPAADREWARADSLTRGLIAGYKQPQYRMVLLQQGYDEYLRQVSWQGERYDRMERDFPGLMAAMRKMSEYQFHKAEKLLAEGEWKEALNHYLLVFKRDTENFSMADNTVYRLAGQNVRQIYDRHFRWQEIVSGYSQLCVELYGMTENPDRGRSAGTGTGKMAGKAPGHLDGNRQTFQLFAGTGGGRLLHNQIPA